MGEAGNTVGNELLTIGVTRGLVSGRFHGYGHKPMEPYNKPLRLDLRVDVSKIDGFEDRRILDVISGDLFFHNEYLITFQLPVDPSNILGTIKGNADIIAIDATTGKRVTDTIGIEYDYQDQICTVAGIDYYMTYASPHFRFLNIELDYSQGITDSDAVVREAEKLMKKYYVKAGFDCRVNDGHSESNPIPGNPTAGWSTYDMNDIQSRFFKAHANDIQWPKFSMYGLLLSRFTQSGVAGIIYDTEDAQQRQGFAVFVEEIRRIQGDVLTNETANRTFLHSLIHEAGHALNFSHSFLPKKGRADAMSWMNYPHKYVDDKKGFRGTRDFWRQFADVLDFDTEELMICRHGPLNWIIPGGANWAGFGVALNLENLKLPEDPVPFKGCSDGDEEGAQNRDHILSIEAYEE